MSRCETAAVTGRSEYTLSLRLSAGAKPSPTLAPGPSILGEGDTPRLRPNKILSVCMYIYIYILYIGLCCVVRVSVSFVRHDVRAWRFVCLCSHAGMVIRPVPPDGSRPPPPQPLPNPLSKAYTVTPSTPPCWLCARMWCGGGGAVVARRLARARDPRKPTK